MGIGNEFAEKHSENEVKKEQLVHGSKWQSVYGGYFSDPGIAAPFLNQIEAAILSAPPQIIVDLGGGVGFMLEQIMVRDLVPSDVRLINLDISEEQQHGVEDAHIEKMVSSMVEFERSGITEKEEKILFITRSTLHYGGIFGLKPILEHIRQQMRPGEYFVHQTGCHENPEEVLLVDELAERMHSNKWVPPLSTLHRLCFEAGFDIETSVSGPVLPIPSDQLISRYGISIAEMEKIHQTLKREYPDTGLIKEEKNGFIVFAPFRILRCRAV